MSNPSIFFKFNPVTGEPFPSGVEFDHESFSPSSTEVRWAYNPYTGVEVPQGFSASGFAPLRVDDAAAEDVKYLRSLSSLSSSNVARRLNEIATRLESKFYVPKAERDDFVSLVQPRTNPVQQPSLAAPALLDQAAKHMRDRAATYDKPEGERSMGKTVDAFNAITGRDLRESEGWLLMALLKMVRSEQRQTPHADSCEDLIAYAALFGEARLGGK